MNIISAFLTTPVKYLIYKLLSDAALDLTTIISPQKGIKMDTKIKETENGFEIELGSEELKKLRVKLGKFLMKIANFLIGGSVNIVVK